MTDRDPDDTVRIGVRVPRSLRQEATEAALAAGVTLTAWVLEALLEHRARCEAEGHVGDGPPPGKQSPPPASRRSR